MIHAAAESTGKKDVKQREQRGYSKPKSIGIINAEASLEYNNLICMASQVRHQYDYWFLIDYKLIKKLNLGCQMLSSVSVIPFVCENFENSCTVYGIL